MQESSTSQIAQDATLRPEEGDCNSMPNINTTERQIQRAEDVAAPCTLPQLINRQYIATHGLTPTQAQGMISQADTFVSLAYTLGSPRVDLLLTLIQFNVFRALVSNT